MKIRLRTAAAAGIVVLLLAAGASCGRKTDPIVPESPRPEKIQDLTIAVRDAVAYLSWPIPSKNVEGKNLSSSAIEGFRVYRAEVDRERRRYHFREAAWIPMAEPAPAQIRDGIVSWSDAGLQYGRVYVYRVRTYTLRGGVSGYSNVVRAAPRLSLAAPQDVTATAGDGSVTISWAEVSTMSDGTPHRGFVGYLIYRASEPGQYGTTSLNNEPVTATTYTDTSALNGKRYFYRVRSVDSPVRPWHESLDSVEVSATPKDMTPPSAPTGLTVVPGIGRVFLTWNENSERDLEGYNVYRSTRRGTGYERLNDTPRKRSTYSDDTVRQGMTYYYVVTAVDKSGNESKPSAERKTYTERVR